MKVIHVIDPVSPRDNPSDHPQPVLKGGGEIWLGSFQAMASDCEVLMEGVDTALAEKLLRAVAIETWRIEHKFSRYVDGNIISRINTAKGQPVDVDEETAGLLDFAEQCYQLSEGLFDITSGVLRRIWRFDGGSKIPSAHHIEETLKLIGWDKVRWQRPQLTLQAGMEIDLGGIGKEYAVDKAIQAIRTNCPADIKASFLVNFGGDLACTGPRLNGEAWRVGVESEHDATAVAQARLREGAVATSGDSRRFILFQGERLGHILNPVTGWPVKGAPHAISVAASNCLQAGIYTTLAMLQGQGAEAFLEAQGVAYWVQR